MPLEVEGEVADEVDPGRAFEPGHGPADRVAQLGARQALAHVDRELVEVGGGHVDALELDRAVVVDVGEQEAARRRAERQGLRRARGRRGGRSAVGWW